MSARIAEPIQPGLMTGTCILSVDLKGRLVIPRVFRGMLGTEFYLAPASHHRVVVFNRKEFGKLVELRQIELRDMSLALCWPVRANNEGRIQMGQVLRVHMDIKPGSEVAVSGVGEAVMLCEYERWLQRFGRRINRG